MFNSTGESIVFVNDLTNAIQYHVGTMIFIARIAYGASNVSKRYIYA